MNSQRPFADQSIVVPDVVRPPAYLTENIVQISATTLHEAAGQIGALLSSIKPFGLLKRMAGPAFTVQSAPGDNLWIHRAISIARPGDVVVVATDNHFETGYWGEIMSTAAKVVGLGGVVIDGCVRDGDLIRTIEVPVYARGLCMRGPQKDLRAAGALNIPIRIGDAIIEPGDMIVGDSDGVVALPSARLLEILEQAKIREIKETKILERLMAGEKTIDIFGWNQSPTTINTVLSHRTEEK